MKLHGQYIFISNVLITFALGGILGHTFSHILSDQYKLLKDGDRFFFTHSNGAHVHGLHLASLQGFVT